MHFPPLSEVLLALPFVAMATENQKPARIISYISAGVLIAGVTAVLTVHTMQVQLVTEADLTQKQLAEVKRELASINKTTQEKVEALQREIFECNFRTRALIKKGVKGGGPDS